MRLLSENDLSFGLDFNKTYKIVNNTPGYVFVGQFLGYGIVDEFITMTFEDSKRKVWWRILDFKNDLIRTSFKERGWEFYEMD
jgi:hypothetical protein